MPAFARRVNQLPPSGVQHRSTRRRGFLDYTSANSRCTEAVRSNLWGNCRDSCRCYFLHASLTWHPRPSPRTYSRPSPSAATQSPRASSASSDLEALRRPCHQRPCAGSRACSGIWTPAFMLVPLPHIHIHIQICNICVRTFSAPGSSTGASPAFLSIETSLPHLSRSSISVSLFLVCLAHQLTSPMSTLLPPAPSSMHALACPVSPLPSTSMRRAMPEEQTGALPRIRGVPVSIASLCEGPGQPVENHSESSPALFAGVRVVSGAAIRLNPAHRFRPSRELPNPAH